MDAIRVLHERTSASKLTFPAPTQDQCRVLVRAALRAADHGNLRPWRFLAIEAEGLNALGDLFVRVAAEKNPDITDVERERFQKMPSRAPMIMVVIAKCQEHPKIPVNEQLLSAGAAAQNILTAAYALGLGAIWRTGDMAYDSRVAQALGLQAGEVIIGFIYLGTPVNPPTPPRSVNPDDFFSIWQKE